MRPTGPIPTLCLVQILIIFLGYITLAVILKGLGWGETDDEFQFTSIASFLRQHSWLPLLASVLWTVAAFWIETTDKGTNWKRWVIILGIALCAILFVAYLWAIVFPGYTPIRGVAMG